MRNEKTDQASVSKQPELGKMLSRCRADMIWHQMGEKNHLVVGPVMHLDLESNQSQKKGVQPKTSNMPAAFMHLFSIHFLEHNWATW
jgi:hypothetical protein